MEIFLATTELWLVNRGLTANIKANFHISN